MVAWRLSGRRLGVRPGGSPAADENGRGRGGRGGSRGAKASVPRGSVVVCAYDAAATLEDCLSSIDALTYPDYEVILVNDGSHDRTGDIGRSHPGVRVVG